MNVTKTAASQHSKTYEMTVTALMTAVTCILAPLSIPIGPVPISFTNLAIYLSLYLLGWKRGTISYLVYLLIGLVGVPVFSGFTGGIDKCHNRWLQLLGMIVGTAVCYAFGTAWFCISASYTVGAALTVCVIPFIPADLIKMVIAMLLGPEIKKRIR